MFSARSRNKHVPPKVVAGELEDVKCIPYEAYCPLLPSGCTIASDLLLSDCYVKQPNLLSFEEGTDLTNPVLQELTACEVIRQHQHSNIATFYGCQSSNGWITGLCFKRYVETMMAKINPGHLNKSMFIQADDRTTARNMATRYLPGIEAGIRHLHALGLAHNDLNPMNVMITEDDTPVIIDFDSCQAIGTTFNCAKRTYGWYDPEVGVSVESNDLDALAEMRVWLTGSSPKEFLFQG